jgi:hypothetical protein
MWLRIDIASANANTAGSQALSIFDHTGAPASYAGNAQLAVDQSDADGHRIVSFVMSQFAIG